MADEEKARRVQRLLRRTGILALSEPREDGKVYSPLLDEWITPGGEKVTLYPGRGGNDIPPYPLVLTGKGGAQGNTAP